MRAARDDAVDARPPARRRAAQNADATVTMVHSRTPDGAKICAEADIVIAACGKAEMITGGWRDE